MKLYWTGTDSLMLIDISKRSFRKKIVYLFFRLLIKLIDPLIQEHYCISENIADNVRKFGTKKKIVIVDTILKHTKKYKKKKHKGFNILYYLPRNKMERSFLEWLYGFDIILQVLGNYSLDNFKNDKNIRFIFCDGSQDMKKIYPITDFYLRPNRHDGSCRIRQECEIQDIPYYWSVTEPNLEEIIKKINYEHGLKNDTRLESKTS